MKFVKCLIAVIIPILILCLFLPLHGYPNDAVWMDKETTAILLLLYGGDIDEVTHAIQVCAGDKAEVEINGERIVVHSFSSDSVREAFVIWMESIKSVKDIDFDSSDTQSHSHSE